MHVDKYGFIVQADGDGGDTAQRHGFYWLAVKLTGQQVLSNPPILGPLDTLDLLSNFRRRGFVRHPFQGPDFRPPETFRDDPNHFSRDQQDVLVCMMSVHTMGPYLRWTAWNHVKRLGRYQNKDWANLSTIGIYIRAFRAWYLWPLLCLLDLQLLFNAFSIWVKAMRNPDHSDDLNHIARLVHAQAVLPTPVSWLARKLYKLIRPKGPLSHAEPSAIMAALRWYFRASNGGNPELAELYRPLVERF